MASGPGNRIHRHGNFGDYLLVWISGACVGRGIWEMTDVLLFLILAVLIVSFIAGDSTAEIEKLLKEIKTLLEVIEKRGR